MDVIIKSDQSTVNLIILIYTKNKTVYNLTLRRSPRALREVQTEKCISIGH